MHQIFPCHPLIIELGLQDSRSFPVHRTVRYTAHGAKGRHAHGSKVPNAGGTARYGGGQGYIVAARHEPSGLVMCYVRTKPIGVRSNYRDRLAVCIENDAGLLVT